MTAPVDAHAHLYDAIHPMAAGVSPVPAGEGDETALTSDMASAGVGGAVLVQPLVYGRDHDLLVTALSTGRFAGVGLIDASTTTPDGADAEAERLRRLGMTGIRIHLEQSTMPVSTAAAAAADRLGLVLDVHVQEPAWPLLFQIADAHSAPPIVVDHLGRPHDPQSKEAMRFVRAIAEREHVAMKMSGLEVISRTGYPYRDMSALFRTAVGHMPADRLMWASNFPYCRGPAYVSLLKVCEELLALDQNSMAAVMGGTARRVFTVPGMVS